MESKRNTVRGSEREAVRKEREIVMKKCRENHKTIMKHNK